MPSQNQTEIDTLPFSIHSDFGGGNIAVLEWLLPGAAPMSESN